nr:MAG TPA: hypothetical protein [Caudoviricetes sp.]
MILFFWIVFWINIIGLGLLLILFLWDLIWN